MSPNEIERLVKECLEDFYRRRLQRLAELKLPDTLRKKNPYLFRAIGLKSASEIIEKLLQYHVSASDEGIFGTVFFEPLAKAVSGGVISPSEGVDIAIEDETSYKAIAVKSGPNIFNSSQQKRQHQEFQSLHSRLRKLQKHFDPVLGHAYGRRIAEPNQNRIYRIVAGQAFWEELTGDPDFYLKIIRLMQSYPEEHRKQYEEEWAKTINRFTRDFLLEFANADGSIDWEKLVKFNSGKVAKR
jgi:hypothetical protein